jgi:hypothetical protein
VMGDTGIGRGGGRVSGVSRGTCVCVCVRACVEASAMNVCMCKSDPRALKKGIDP